VWKAVENEINPILANNISVCPLIHIIDGLLDYRCQRIFFWGNSFYTEQLSSLFNCIGNHEVTFLYNIENCILMGTWYRLVFSTTEGFSITLYIGEKRENENSVPFRRAD